jgi:phosphoglycolate phosphatase
LMVGDTEYDMQMSGAIGVPAVGIEHGVHTRERLLEHGALACVADLFELSEWLGLPMSQSPRS